MKTLGFIGVGNMGSAMIRAILKEEEVQVNLYDVNQSLYEQFDLSQQIKGCVSLEALVKDSQMIFLTVKPHFYEHVLTEMKKFLQKEQVVITVAPGYTLDKVKEQLGGTHEKIVRTMPNTPAMVGMGVTTYTYAEGTLTEEEIQGVRKYLETFGKCYELPERLIDASVPVSGSSPAYAYLFIEAMADAAVKFGLPRDLAYEMSAQTLKGSAEMVLQTKQHPAVLKDAVTSPGGTTIEAIAKLEAEGFRSSVIEAMTVCFEKTLAMGQ